MTCGNIIEQTPLTGLLDRSVREMTRRVAGIDLVHADFSVRNDSGWSTFVIHTAGDYEAVLALSAEDAVFCQIAGNMKRNSEVLWKDIVIYTTEYYNILCGFFISHLNTALKLKARFGIPEMIRGRRIHGGGYNGTINLKYKCQYGNLQVHAAGLPLYKYE